MKKRKGFTLVEMVVTIAILSVALALTVIAFGNLSRIQTSASNQLAATREIEKIDSLTKDYISIVSLRTSSIKFDYEDVEKTDNYVSFKEDNADPSYKYTLRFIGSTISYFSDYTGENSYLKQSQSLSLKTVNKIVFSYDTSIGFLVLDIHYNGTKNIKYSYIVRTAL